jgi:hypothetical protein
MPLTLSGFRLKVPSTSFFHRWFTPRVRTMIHDAKRTHDYSGVTVFPIAHPKMASFNVLFSLCFATRSGSRINFWPVDNTRLLQSDFDRIVATQGTDARRVRLCVVRDSRYYRPRINQTRLFSLCFRLLFTIASSPALFTASFRINKP